KLDTSILFITHDLGVVAQMADRVAVMYAGKIIEIGTVDEIFYNPQHPYTWGLLASIPTTDLEEHDLYNINGTPPNLLHVPKGDPFAPRNEYALEIDFEVEPEMFKVSETHYAATWLLHPYAPKVTPPKEVMRRREKFLSLKMREVI
ncbi:MAG: Oligopeptide transport system permease protein OppB, partial [Sedimentibacter sp.]|nr:Oligopeptide transport system permease protein OppB [Sedimentibacter sp.]